MLPKKKLPPLSESQKLRMQDIAARAKQTLAETQGKDNDPSVVVIYNNQLVKVPARYS